MKHIFKKTTVFLLCVAMVFSVASCDKGNGEPDSGFTSTGEIEIWSKPSTVNVMQDIDYDESFKDIAEYRISAGKGEYEASQIIITVPKGKIEEYFVSVSDFTCGDAVIDSSYVDIYNEKYIEVISTPSSASTGLGWYADALLPFDAAVEYGENVVGSNDGLRNQGIYIETFIPRNATSGEYTGTITLTIDSKEIFIPASVTVYDFEVSQESHFGQDWIVGNRWSGDLDSTPENMKRYFVKTANYRASTHSMNMGQENIDEWVNVVRQYTNPNLRDEDGNPLIGEKESYLAAINLPAAFDSTYGIDRTQFDNYISKLVYWSIKDGYDYLAKVGTYPGFVDEPQYNGTWAKVKQACDGWNNYKNYWANEIIATNDFATINKKIQELYEKGTEVDESLLLAQVDFDNLSDDFKTQLVKSMSLIGFYVTSPIDSRLDNTATTQFCFPEGGISSQEDLYNAETWTDVETNGNWAYSAGCGQFGNNIDTEPLSQRTMCYSMYERNITGFLVWEVAQYVSITWDSAAKAHLRTPCDPYSLALRISNGPGDGYLYYPGKAYGIDGPVGSIRAHQYRDSSEEYEYFYLLEQLYSEHGYSPKSVLQKIFESLYNESRVTDDTEIFAKQRAEIINLILLAQKGVFVTEYSEVNAKAEMKVVSVGNEEIVSVNGETVVNTKNAVVMLDMTTKSGNLSFGTANGGNFTLYLEGKATLIQGVDASVMAIDGGVITQDSFEGNSSLRLDFSVDNSLSVDEQEYRVTFAMDKSKISRETGALAATFYNPGEKAVLVELWFMGKDGRTVYVDDLVVYSGEYGVMKTTRLDAVKWSTIRSLEGVRYKITSLEGEENYSVHFLGLYSID